MLRLFILMLFFSGLTGVGSSIRIMANGREPAFSADGRFVIYRNDGEEDGEPELYRVELSNGRITNLKLAGTSPVRISGEHDIFFLGSGIFPELYQLDTRVWKAVSFPLPIPPSGPPFPVGKHLIAYPAGYEEPVSLVLFNLVAGKRADNGPKLPAGTVKLSPDGKYAAVQTRIQGVCNLELRELKSGKILFQTNAQPGAMQINGCHSPDFSPDSRYLVYVSGNIQPLADLMLLDLRTGKIKPLTSDGADNQSPHFSPDGRFLVFSSCRNGKYQICLMPFLK